MLEQPEQKPARVLRKMWMGFGVVAAIVIAYTAFVFWSRWQENSDIAAKEKAAQAAKSATMPRNPSKCSAAPISKSSVFTRCPERFNRGDSGGYVLRSLQRQVRETRSADVASMFPSLDRCVKVAPKKTTTYTFTADDGKGNTKTAQLTIEVH